MTKYTVDAHALPYPEGQDRVAVAADLRALAVQAGNAISIEGKRAEGAARVEAISTAAVDATRKADAAIAEAKTYTDKVLSTSHLAMDTDGTPYFQPGSMTHSIHMDTDGNPFFLDA